MRGPIDELLARSRACGRERLDEHESLLVLEALGIPAVRRRWIEASRGANGAVEAALEIGFPVVVKGIVAGVSHKTERGLVRTGLADGAAVQGAVLAICGAAPGELEALVVAEHVGSGRELACGLVRDGSFGPCVMVGAGGIHAEAMADAAFCVAPLQERDAIEAISRLAIAPVLEASRGLGAADLSAIARVMAALGDLGLAHPEIAEIDINPLLVRADGSVVAADALIVIEAPGAASRGAAS